MQRETHDHASEPSRSRSIATAAAAGLVFACSSPGPIVPVLPDASRISGQVVEIDPEASRVVLLDAGRRLAVSYGPETIVKRGAVDLSPTDIRPGDRLVVSLDRDGLDRARVIAVAARPVPKLPLALLVPSATPAAGSVVAADTVAPTPAATPMPMATWLP